MISRLFSQRVLAVSALLLVPASQVCGEPIWSYSASFTATGRYAGTNFPAPPSPLNQYPGDQVSYSINHGNMFAALIGLSGQETGSMDSGPRFIHGFDIFGRAFNGSPGEVGNFSPDKNTFDLTITLTDKTSGASGSLIFHGGLGGNSQVGALPIPFDSFYVRFTNQPQTLQFGSNRYTVSMGGDGRMFVQVTTVPEPASLALLGSGLA